MITLHSQFESLIKSTSNLNNQLKNRRSLQFLSQSKEIHLGVVGKRVEISDKIKRKQFSTITRSKTNQSISSQTSPSKITQKINPFRQLDSLKSSKSRGSIRITSFNSSCLKPAGSLARSLTRKQSFHVVKRFCKDQKILEDWTVEESYASSPQNLSNKPKSHFTVDVPGIKIN